MQQIMASEPWYSIDQKDVFPEEFLTFVSSRPDRRALFKKHHGDLLDVDYWKTVQERIRQGKYADVFPYAQEVRFKNIYSEVLKSDNTA